MDESGTVLDSFQLPLPEGYSSYSFDAFAASDNPYIAYRVSNEDKIRNQFMVYRYGDMP